MTKLEEALGRRVDTKDAIRQIVRDGVIWARDHRDEWDDGDCGCDPPASWECHLSRLIGYLATGEKGPACVSAEYMHYMASGGATTPGKASSTEQEQHWPDELICLPSCAESVLLTPTGLWAGHGHCPKCGPFPADPREGQEFAADCGHAWTFQTTSPEWVEIVVPVSE